MFKAKYEEYVTLSKRLLTSNFQKFTSLENELFGMIREAMDKGTVSARADGDNTVCVTFDGDAEEYAFKTERLLQGFGDDYEKLFIKKEPAKAPKPADESDETAKDETAAGKPIKTDDSAKSNSASDFMSDIEDVINRDLNKPAKAVNPKVEHEAGETAKNGNQGVGTIERKKPETGRAPRVLERGPIIDEKFRHKDSIQEHYEHAKARGVEKDETPLYSAPRKEAMQENEYNKHKINGQTNQTAPMPGMNLPSTSNYMEMMQNSMAAFMSMLMAPMMGAMQMMQNGNVPGANTKPEAPARELRHNDADAKEIAEGFKAKINARDEKISTLKEENESLKEEIKHLKETASSDSDSFEEIGRLKDKIESNNSYIRELKEQANSARKDADDARAELKNAKRQIGDKDRQLAELRNKAQDNGEIQTLKDRLAKAGEETAAAQKKASSFEDEISRYKSRIAELEAKVNELEQNAVSPEEYKSLKEKNGKLYSLAFTDALTGLPNNNSLDKFDPPDKYVLAKIRISNMSEANEIYGIEAGNNMIMMFVDTLKNTFTDASIFRGPSVSFYVISERLSMQDMENALSNLRNTLSEEAIEIAYGVSASNESGDFDLTREGAEEQLFEEVKDDAETRLMGMLGVDMTSYDEDDIEDV